MATPLTIIGGYLGAGKTTLINRVLSSPNSGRTAVVVNDFGDVNIDSELIKSTGATTMELTNGCICCQITDDVQNTMSALAARTEIDNVICEVSGIGDPSQLGKWRTFPGFRPGPVVVCADAVVTPHRLADEYVADVAKRQIASADIILVTKTDLATGHQIDETMEACSRIAPKAQIRAISHGDPASLLSLAATWAYADSRQDTNPEVSAPSNHHANIHQTTTIKLPRGVTVDVVANLLEKHAQKIVRAKGVVRDASGGWTQVHLASGSVATSPIPPGLHSPPRSEVVLIAAGPHADRNLATLAAGLYDLA